MDARYSEDDTLHYRSADSMSVHSDSPLRSPPLPPASSYPPLPPDFHEPGPSSSSTPNKRKSRRVQISESLKGYDTNRTVVPPPMPTPGQSSGLHQGGRSGSWDMLAGIRKIEHSYDRFDTRNASEAHLVFADGDVPNNKFVKVYNYLLNVSIVTRWFLFIVPVMAILWIPGILGQTTYPNAKVWGVKLLWWSIWLNVMWGGWWAALAASMITPHIARNSVGLVAVGARRYIDWLQVLHRYVALFLWTLATWVSFQPLIYTRREKDATQGDTDIINLITKLLFALMLCTAVLLGEKFAIQWIAGKFHERSYAERIADQKIAIRTLTTLYRHSHDIPGRIDTLKDALDKRASVDPKRFLKRAFKGVKSAATTTTTALGTVASEIAGTSVLQPNSPQAKVQTALESANKSRLLARRLFYSFAKPGADYLLVGDVAMYFPTPEDADAAFAIFDQDSNGDATRDEIEMACLEIHREQLSIEHSMRDLDSAVGRLDNILMSLYVVVAILIVAVAMEAQLVTLITGAGTLILGLSWLIGSSLAEVLTSIIFLFVKHPYDVGDRIQVDTEQYTVKEIRLLSTIFLDSRSCYVQAPNTVLSTKFIENIRRSPQMSEPFTWDVAYSTSFEQIEQLRSLMLAFLQDQRRDYLSLFDVFVVDMPEQGKMSLKADIKYKSNWQQGALKAKRRNKWICALKTSMLQVKMYGPNGDPDAQSPPKEVTLIPWDEVKPGHKDSSDLDYDKDQTLHGREPSGGVNSMQEPRIPQAWTFSDQNAVLMDDSQDVFGEQGELYTPRRSPTQSPVPTGMDMPQAVTMPQGPGHRPSPVSASSSGSISLPPRGSFEEIELKTPRAFDSFSNKQG